MTERPSALQRIILSPGVSVLLAVGAALLIAAQGASWLIPAAELAVAGVMIHTMRREALFRGSYFPFAALMLTAQTALPCSIEGLAVLALALVAYISFSFCYLRPQCTRTIFTVNLLCGCGLLWSPCFAWMSAVVLLLAIVLRVFSLRGLVAALLGLVTPAVLALPFGIDRLIHAAENIAVMPVPALSTPLLIVGCVALVAGLATFLTAYGYPAKSRTRNMALLLLSVCAVVMAAVDSTHLSAYCPLLCFCCAYNLTHFVSTNRIGWVYVLLAYALLIGASLYFA